ncbi:MAG: hypothetical protein AAF903_02055 [Pseudomonadota bacterium]
MRNRPVYFASALFAAVFASTSSFAADCSCSVAGDAVAQINSAQGTVFVSGRDGFSPATKGMAIKQGMQLVTGAGATAQVAFASGCKANVAANQSLQIVKAANSKLCVQVSNFLGQAQGQFGQAVIGAGAAGAGAAAGTGGFLATVGVSGAVFGGVAAAAVGSAAASASQADDEDDVPPGPAPVSN